MTPLRSNSVVHLELHTRDLLRARNLYSELCGWRQEWIETRSGSYLSLELGDGLEEGSSSAPSRVRSGCRTSKSTTSSWPPPGPAASAPPSSSSLGKARPDGEASSTPP